MGWFANSVSVLLGYQTETTIQNILSLSTFLNEKTGVWKIALHGDIKRTEAKIFLMNWMRTKDFQSIVNSPRHICFIHIESNRVCFCCFYKDSKHGNCIKLYMIDKNDGKYINGSETDTFAKSIFTVLSIDMAKLNLLQPQLYNGFPVHTLTETDRIAKENTLIDPKNNLATLFVRMNKHQEVMKIVISTLEKQRFSRNMDKPDEISMVLYGKTVECNVSIGYNPSCHVLVQLQFKEIVVGCLSTANHVKTCTQRIALNLAQDEYLRSQKFANVNVSAEELSEEEQLEMIDTLIEDIIPVNELGLN